MLTKAGFDVIDYCRSPIPRTATAISCFVRNEQQVPPASVSRLQASLLSDLVKTGYLIQYAPRDGELWFKARKLLEVHCKTSSLPLPRKVSGLYQTNFFFF